MLYCLHNEERERYHEKEARPARILARCRIVCRVVLYRSEAADAGIAAEAAYRRVGFG